MLSLLFKNKLGYGCDEEILRVSKMLTGFSAGNVTQQSSKITYPIGFKFKFEQKKYVVEVITQDVSLSEEQKKYNQSKSYNRNFNTVIAENTNEYRIRGILRLPLIPLNNEVTIITIKQVNKHPNFYFETFEVKENRKFDMKYKRISYRALNEEIEKLRNK